MTGTGLGAVRTWTSGESPFLSQPDVLAQAPGGTVVAWRDPVLASSRLELLPGEVLLGVLRPDLRGVLGPLLNAIFWAVVVGAITAPSSSLVGGLFSALFTATSLSIRTIASLIGTRYFLTTRRLVVSHEFIWTDEVSLHLDRIQQATEHQGVIARLFDAGTVRVRSAASSRTTYEHAQRQARARRRDPFAMSVGMVQLRGVMHPRSVRSVIQWLQGGPAQLALLDPGASRGHTSASAGRRGRSQAQAAARTALWREAAGELTAVRHLLRERQQRRRTEAPPTWGQRSTPTSGHEASPP